MLVAMAPRDEFTAEDFENPDAPEGERRLRADHPLVRDLSYDRDRMRQLLDLWKQSFVSIAREREPGDVDPHDESTWPRYRLELYMKERSRGPGYVSDFLYTTVELPVLVYGVFINRGRGLEIAELELFRSRWGYTDDEDDETLQGDEVSEEQHGERPLITSDLLRRIPLGLILAEAQKALAEDDWREDGIQVLMGSWRTPDELTAQEVRVLESANKAAAETRRGRPELSDELLDEVARAYLREAAAGSGLTRRLALHFDRPEATVRDWVAAARRRGFLSAAVPGRRGAAPGPRLGTTTARSAEL